MSWNYRVVVDGTFYGIHEVYYDAKGDIIACTENPVVIGSSSQSLNELEKEYVMMGEALSKPPILYTDIGEKDDTTGDN